MGPGALSLPTMKSGVASFDKSKKSRSKAAYDGWRGWVLLAGAVDIVLACPPRLGNLVQGDCHSTMVAAAPVVATGLEWRYVQSRYLIQLGFAADRNNLEAYQ